MTRPPYNEAPSRLLDRRQLLGTSWGQGRRASTESLPPPDAGACAGSCQLAQPDRNLLLDRPAEGSDTQRLSRLSTLSPSVCWIFNTTGRIPLSPSNGSSPARTSTNSSSSSAPNANRQKYVSPSALAKTDPLVLLRNDPAWRPANFPADPISLRNRPGRFSSETLPQHGYRQG